MITPGLCDRRLTFYEPVASGGDGFARTVYAEAGTYWGRIDDLVNTQTVANTPMAHVDQRVNARAAVAWSVPVPSQGYVRIDAGPLYAIRGVVQLRQLRMQRIELEFVDPTASTTVDGIEALAVADGIHLTT